MGSTLRAALHTYTFALVGVFLVGAPWSPLWDNVALIVAPTPFAEIAKAGWLRGLFSGLGALNLAVAMQEGNALWKSVRQARAAQGGE